MKRFLSAVLLAILLPGAVLAQPTSAGISPKAFGYKNWRENGIASGSLPTTGNNLWDVRLASNATLYYWSGSAWVAIAGGGGSGGGWTDDGAFVHTTTATDAVGIGTSTPSNLLEVQSTTDPVIELTTTAGAGRSWWLHGRAGGVVGNFGLFDATAGTYRLLVDASGNIAFAACIQLGSATTPGSASCLCRDVTTDRIYGDLNCDGTKSGEEFVDNAGGGGGAHAMLSSTHTDTTAASVARGDLITGQSASPTWQRLAKGSADTYLGSDGTDLLWRAPSGGGSVLGTGRGLVGGAGIAALGTFSSDLTVQTASQEASFLADGGVTDLTCGSSNQGKLQVLDDGTLQWCDGATTSAVQKVAGFGTAIDASEIASDAVTEAKLDFVDAPADEECATYESTGGRLEWQACGAGGSSNSFETWDAPNGTDPVADSSTDTLQFLDGDGIKITGDSSADSLTIARKDPLVYAEWTEEFCERNTGPNLVGKSWASYGNLATGETPAEANHPCIQYLGTDTTSGNTQSIGMGKFGSTDNFKVADHLDHAWFVIKTDTTITSMEIRVGFMEDTQNTTGGDGFFVEYDSAADSHWRCVTRQGGTSTATASSVTVATSTWYQIEIERASNGDHKCYVNSSTAFATHTSNLPTGALQFGMAVQTNTTAARYAHFDFIRLRSKALGQRY